MSSIVNVPAVYNNLIAEMLAVRLSLSVISMKLIIPEFLDNYPFIAFTLLGDRHEGRTTCKKFQL